MITFDMSGGEDASFDSLSDDVNSVRWIYGSGFKVMGLFNSQNEAVVQAVLFATSTSRGSGFVTFGTIGLDDNGEVHYRNEPRDKMIVYSPGVFEMELKVEVFKGIHPIDPKEFLSQRHEISYTISSSAGDFSIKSHRDHTEYSGRIQGVSKDIAGDVDLKCDFSGDYHFNRDVSGSLYEENLNFRGVIYRKEFFLNLKELQSSRIVRAISGGETRVVSSSLFDIDSRLRFNDNLYQANIMIRKVFQDGSPIEPDFWKKTSGLVRKNKKILGSISAIQGGTQTKIILRLPYGSFWDLEVW